MFGQSLILDRYRVINEAGSGGYATVQHGYDTRLKRDVAIKCIPLSPAEEAQARLMEIESQLQGDGSLEDEGVVDEPNAIPGLEEAQTAAHLSDANIVTVYDCEVHEGVAYIIMEYVEGMTLTEVLDEVGDDISLDMVASVVSSIAHALKVAHGKEVLHLDIKPDNVIINKQGVVKVTDFGLATLMDASGCGTAGGGTIGYMPLEQMREEPLDVRTDEWALASLTYEMLTGTNPFFADSLSEAETAIEDAVLVLPSRCWDELGEGVDDVIFKGLGPLPDERYENVSAFANAIKPFLGSPAKGRRQLEDIVGGEEPEEEPPAEEVEEIREPLLPFVDRIGVRGASILMKVVSLAGVLTLGTVGLLNIPLNPYSVFGLVSDMPILFWAVLGVLAIATAIRPHIGALAVYVLFAIAYFMNGAFVLALALVIVSFLWWFFLGRKGNAQAMCGLVQPFFGGIGFGGMGSIAAGCLLPVGQALGSSLFSCFTALCLASLGSRNVMGWNMLINGRFIGLDIQAVFLNVIQSLGTWIVLLTWVLAALCYSVFCLRGSRGFDITGSVGAAILLVVGACGYAFFQSLGLSWTPEMFVFLGALVPGAIGVALALLGVPDRARIDEEEWRAISADY